ncbi:MAG: hypothetical protein A2Y33_08270 [Spirochaetes bacterium GWF1_51_8]|nr:MAG: hypothetical protein A2Y33_08270 [Spirochaetes bacterium GWF1_51_8]
MKTFKKIIDNFLLFIILLSIAQIIIDDLAIIGSWTTALPWAKDLDLWMIIVGFAFDVIFTLEFLVRAIAALAKGRFVQYFIYEKGWIDLIASIPLLVLLSGPAFYEYVFNGVIAIKGNRFVGNLKIIKAIRVSRILRLLRVLKIFGKIENAMSKMSQHHVSTVSALVVTVSVAVFMFLTAVGFADFGESAIIEARVSLIFTIVTIANVLLIALLYGRHFAQNVSDPLYVMKRGMIEEDYNFTVKSKEHYKDEEVFELADAYNTMWLPLKVRIQTLRKKKQNAQMQSGTQDDYSDLLK